MRLHYRTRVSTKPQNPEKMAENEKWQNESNNEERTSQEGARERNYERVDTQRNYRPRYNSYNDENVERPQRNSYRPRYNSYSEENGDRPQRSYHSYDRDGGNGGNASRGGYRPRYNNDRNNEYNNRGGYNRSGNDYNNRENRGGNEYNNNRGGGEYRPRYNNYRNNDEQGQQNTYHPRYNNYRHNDEQGGENEYRPRYNEYRGNDNEGYRPRNNNARPSYNNRRPSGQNPYNNRGRRPMNNQYDASSKEIRYAEASHDPNEELRLNKFLANAGVCSRREADEYIQAGVVSVNGEVVTELGTKVKRSDEVKFHNETVSIERKIYVLLNKPKDTVTTVDDPQERKTVLDLVKGACEERIYPVGRLDRNTTGVLLLTNDGDMASKLTHPKFLKKKIYHVYTDKSVTQADMDKIAAGIELDDGLIQPDGLNYVGEKRNQVGIEIHSGKNRIVRRIFESLGYRVTKLDRVLFAGLTKKGLRRGDWRFLNEKEVNFLRMGSFE